MNDEIIPDFLSHDQVIAGIQRYYDMLWELHDDFLNEENHLGKEVILGLIDSYSDIFDALLCYRR